MPTHFRLLLLGLATAVASLPACHSDPPVADRRATAAPAAPAAALPAAPATTDPPDTLHLPAGVVQLRSTTAEAFYRLPAPPLPELVNDPAAEPLAATHDRVRREGRDLLLPTTARGATVRLTSTPDAQFTLQNGDAVKYRYWGSLPAAHQWVVREWFWESDATLLIDQRTGHRLEVMGRPTLSADGRFVVLASPGLGGGDQPNALSLVQIAADGPHLLWQREPTAWEPEEVRWANPGVAVLKRRHTLADGSMADDARISYVELPLPR